MVTLSPAVHQSPPLHSHDTCAQLQQSALQPGGDAAMDALVGNLWRWFGELMVDTSEQRKSFLDSTVQQIAQLFLVIEPLCPNVVASTLAGIHCLPAIVSLLRCRLPFASEWE